MIKAVIFDLDGTLLDTLEDIADTVNTILIAHGYPEHPTQKYRNFIGHGITVTIERALPENHRCPDTIHELSEAFESIYVKNSLNKTRPYPGITELLDTLTSKKIKLAILSNKAHQFTQHYANTLLTQWHFDHVFGHKEGAPKKPDPSGAFDIAKRLNLPSRNIMYVGDSDVDMQAAVAASMYPMGVSWGLRSRDALVASGAKKIIDSPIELLNHLAY